MSIARSWLFKSIFDGLDFIYVLTGKKFVWLVKK